MWFNKQKIYKRVPYMVGSRISLVWVGSLRLKGWLSRYS